MCVTWFIHICDMTLSYVCDTAKLVCARDMTAFYVCDVTHSDMWHDSFTCVWHCKTRLRERHDSFLCVWHDSFSYVTWLIYVCVTLKCVWYNEICLRETWLIWLGDMTHLTWLVSMCDITHGYVWDVLFLCVTWLNHVYDMTNFYVWHDSFSSAKLACKTDMTHFYVCDMTTLILAPNISHVSGSNSPTWETWLIFKCDMTLANQVRVNSIFCVSRLWAWLWVTYVSWLVSQRSCVVTSHDSRWYR